MINLIDFLASSNGIKLENESTSDALKCLLEKDPDYVSCPVNRHYAFYNVAILNMDHDGKYYYEEQFYGRCDVMGNIVSQNENVKIFVRIGAQLHDSNGFYIIPMALRYDAIHLRFVFDKKPAIEDEFSFFCTAYYFNQLHRRDLESKKIDIGPAIYSDGILFLPKWMVTELKTTSDEELTCEPHGVNHGL